MFYFLHSGLLYIKNYPKYSTYVQKSKDSVIHTCSEISLCNSECLLSRKSKASKAKWRFLGKVETLELHCCKFKMVSSVGNSMDDFKQLVQPSHFCILK